MKIFKFLLSILLGLGIFLLVSMPAKAQSLTRRTWVEVDLSTQKLRLWQNGRVISSSFVSTGISRHPTPVGQFRIWGKYSFDDMKGGSKIKGDYYFLPKVPYVMYFYRGYALHGTYWHKNFGKPMSHGCINLPTSYAKYLFQNLKNGDLVVIHR